MVDPFENLIPDARDFLTRLRANNSRDWFTAHKPEYDTNLKTPAGHLLDTVAANLGRMTGTFPKSKLFRIHRDLRFSRDKTPYKTRLSMFWSHASTPQTPQNGWFFTISPDTLRIGGGLMPFGKVTLPQWRAGLAGPLGDDITAHLSALMEDGFELDDPVLKRVPAPYNQDHDADTPIGALLRRKSMVIWQHPTPPVNDITGELTQQFARLWGFQKALADLF